MTNKEANVNLKLAFLKMGLSGTYPSNTTVEAFDLACDALKRRTPLEPEVYGDGYADGKMVYDMWKCPNCGKSYELDNDEYNYCPCCGQAIDWSEDDE